MTDAQNPILSTHGLTKRFFGTLALDDIDFDVVPGEIHALIGENGAEKSTVIKVLAGVHQLDGGTIVFDGATVDPVTQRLPIAFVHQDLGLVEELSIGENVALVAGFPRRHGLIDWVRVWQRAREIYRLMEVDGIDPRTSVRSLDAAGKAVLGIVRALALQARVIVLDEPTAALPEPDVQHLLRILRTLRAGGTSIVYVSHRLGELFDFADRITVLRDGRTVRTVRTEDVTPSELVEDMLGHAVTGLQQASHPIDTARPSLSLEGVWIGGRGPVDCHVCAGEIVGLVGLRGAGQEEIGRTVFGATHAKRGRIRLHDVEIPLNESIATRIRRGIALLPGDRTAETILAGMTVLENLFPNAGILGLSAMRLTSRRSECEAARAVLDRFDVRPRAELALIDWLSGGNQQKVALARWLVANMRVLVLEQPTAGVDVGVKVAIHQMLRDAVSGGQVAVVVVSSDFEEVATLCDRALIVNQGVIAGELAGEHLTVDELVAAATLGAGVAGTSAATAADGGNETREAHV
jgi:ribose transport system ATP-binding protein